MIKFYSNVYTTFSSSTKQTALIRTTYGDYAYYLGTRLGATGGTSGAAQNEFIILRTSKDIEPPNNGNSWSSGYTQIGSWLYFYNTIQGNAFSIADKIAITMHQYDASYPHVFKIDSMPIAGVNYNTTSAGFFMPTAFKLNGRNFVGWGGYAIEDDGTTE